MAENNNFVGYEYKAVKVPKELESLWNDSMMNFGWQLEKSQPARVKHIWGPLRVMIAPLALIPGTPFRKMVMDHDSDTEVEMTYKRDKHIANKAELNRLQTQFESYARGIETLEDSKSIGATAGAYAIGLVGTVLMGLATFSYLAGSLPLMAALAIPGFIAWVLPYFVYHKVKASKSSAVEPKIETQHDNIYDICQKASCVLAGASV